MTIRQVTQSIAKRSPVVRRVTSRYLDFTLYVGIFIVIAALKTPIIFSDPRFWAEEGTDYYRYCSGRSFGACISYVHAGSYQLFTNFIVYISTKVSVLHAPFVTAYLTLVFHLLVVGQIVLFSRAYRISLGTAILLVAAWALLPQSFEVWMTATNVQWIAGVSMLLIIVMPIHWIEEHWKGIMAWGGLCGLAGMPAVIVTPIVFLRAMMQGSRRMLAVAAMLGSVAALQGIVLMMTGTSGRAYPLNPITVVMPLFFQTVLSPLFSIDFASALGQGDGTTLLGVLILGSGIMAVVIAIARIGTPSEIIIFTLVAWVTVTIMQTFGGLEPQKMMSGIYGGRYFLFGSMCLCVMLAWGTKAQTTYLKITATCLLTSITISGVADTLFSPQIGGFLNGPSWGGQIRACPEARPCQISIWPGRGVWVLDIIRNPRVGGGEEVKVVK